MIWCGVKWSQDEDEVKVRTDSSDLMSNLKLNWSRKDY